MCIRRVKVKLATEGLDKIHGREKITVAELSIVDSLRNDPHSVRVENDASKLQDRVRRNKSGLLSNTLDERLPMHRIFSIDSRPRRSLSTYLLAFGITGVAATAPAPDSELER